MAVGVTLKQRGASGSEVPQAASNLSLESPMDVSLTQGAAAIVASDKLGSDLHLSFADGETLQVQDFFVIGPDGDFSRLLLPSGEPFVTGLMGPEPAYEAGGGAQGQTPEGSGAEGATRVDAAGSQDVDAAEGMDWSNPMLLAGAGLSLGSGVEFLSGGDNEPAPPTAREEDAEFARAIDELTGRDPDTLDPAEYDLEAQTAEPETDEAAENVAAEAVDPADGTVDGTFVDGTGMAEIQLPVDAEAQHDMLAELMTEFVL